MPAIRLGVAGFDAGIGACLSIRRIASFDVMAAQINFVSVNHLHFMLAGLCGIFSRRSQSVRGGWERELCH